MCVKGLILLIGYLFNFLSYFANILYPMKKYTLLHVVTFLLFCISPVYSFAQKHPIVEWNKTTYGGTKEDGFAGMQPGVNGGFVLAGSTYSNDGDIVGFKGYSDGRVILVNADGTLQWQKCLGGTGPDDLLNISNVSDGYLAVGFTQSNDGDIPHNHGMSDAWLVKLSNLGAVIWSKAYGGSKLDEAYSAVKTTDGGYIFTGETGSVDGDANGTSHGGSDMWVVKLDVSGGIQWQKKYGGSRNDQGISIKQTVDGGYIVAGNTFSNDGDVIGHHDSTDIWVVKLTDTGTISWAKDFGGTARDNAFDIHQTTDGGYIVVGNTLSDDGDIAYNHGDGDAWLLKLDATGNLLWEKTYGGSKQEITLSLLQTSDAGYLLTSFTYSNDGDVSGNHGNSDAWLLKTDSIGTIQWQKCLGGKVQDEGYRSVQVSDSEYLMAGSATSVDGDVTGYRGGSGSDAWLLKLAITDSLTSVATLATNDNNIKVYPTCTNTIVHVDMPFGYESAELKLTNIIGMDNSNYILAGSHRLKRIIDFSGGVPGMYVLQVKNKGIVTSYKIMYMP